MLLPNSSSTARMPWSDVTAFTVVVAVLALVVVPLAKSLDLEVVAEERETTGPLSFLGPHGCEGFQGYLFEGPGPGPVELLERVQLPGHSALSLHAALPAQQEPQP